MIYGLVCTLLMISTVDAAEVMQNQWHHTTLKHQQLWKWQLKSDDMQGRQLQIDNGKNIYAYDLMGCRFCSGEDDGCHATGIVIKELSFYSNPVFIAVCHQGAHSMKMFIFDPKKKSSEAIYTRHGIYYLHYTIQPRGLNITFDDVRAQGCDADGVCFEERQQWWPARE
ncbi:MAG: hypothetical protein Q9M28_11225 [Mariprofundaceae bacterium]|nr:hypothetical protein [Mariprofundaceae bacterium]